MRNFLILCVTALIAGCLTPVGGPNSMQIAMAPANPPALPRAGDRYSYLVVNGYNSEPVGQVEYRVESAVRDHYVAEVTASAPSVGQSRTEMYLFDGNWLRHPLSTHNQQIEYEFNPPYPAYVFPLDVRRSWSQRVNARNPATGKVLNVRVDGEVLGAERIVTAAGEFDTFRIMRRIYTGDWDGFLTETNISEVEWYAPAIGRAVRLDRNSQWYDSSRSAGGNSFWYSQGLLIRGDWHVFELMEWPGMKARPVPPRPPADK